MKKSRLGEFQELILMTIIVLQDEAYGNSIQRELEERLGEKVSIGAIQTALKRMEEKGFVKSGWSEATAERGGRRKRQFAITGEGRTALEQVRDLRVKLWNQIPGFNTNISFA